MPTISSACRDIVEDAYRVFATYRIGDDLAVCRCELCVDDEAERALVTTPLRDLPAIVLAEYTNSAHDFDRGRVSDELRYFLPRYLELIAALDPPCQHGFDICLRRLGHANYREMWPRAEGEVIDRFFDAFFEQCLTQTTVCRVPSGWRLTFNIAEIVTMIATASGDLERMFATWEAAAHPGAALHMAALRDDLMRVRDELWLDSPYLSDYPEARQKVGAWLSQQRVVERIERAAASVNDDAWREILNRGLDPLP